MSESNQAQDCAANPRRSPAGEPHQSFLKTAGCDGVPYPLAICARSTLGKEMQDRIKALRIDFAHNHLGPAVSQLSQGRVVLSESETSSSIRLLPLVKVKKPLNVLEMIFAHIDPDFASCTINLILLKSGWHMRRCDGVPVFQNNSSTRAIT